MKIKVITPPAVEPVDLNTDVKPQLRLDPADTDYDAVLRPLLVAAREWCEGYQNRAYIKQTLEIALDDWPCENVIDLPRPPLQTVSSFKYTDYVGVESIWADTNYTIDDYSFVPKLAKNKFIYWPLTILAGTNGIKIQYVAGYSDDGTKVPRSIKQAITLLVIHWFENGMSDPPQAVLSLLNMERVVPV